MNNWSLGINLTILGMGTVFLVLAVLAVAMILLNNFYESLSGKKKTKEDKSKVSKEKRNTINNNLSLKTVDSQNGTSVQGENVHTKGISAEVIAVIAASIAVVLEKSPSDIKLTSVRKINDISSGAWVQQGRLSAIGARASFFARKGNRG